MWNVNRLDRIARHRHWLKSLPLLVLALSLGATYGAWRVITDASSTEAQAAYGRKTAEIVARIVDRLQDYEELLRGAVGLFNARGAVTRDDWQLYIASIRPEANSPRIPAIGFAAWTTQPGTGRPVSTPVTFQEPSSGSNPFPIGYNLYTDPTCRAAMDQSRDTGATIVAGRITTAPSEGHEALDGLLVLTPVYRRGIPADSVESRRAALQGFVYSLIRMDDFISTALVSIPVDIAFTVFDGDSPETAARLYTNLPSDKLLRSHPSVFSSTMKVRVYTRAWAISFATLPVFDREFNHSHSSTVLWGGIAVGFLLSFIASALLSTAGKMQESENRFRSMANSAPVLIWMTDPWGFCTWLNQAWRDFTGRTLAQDLGRGWMEALHPEDRTAMIDEGFRSMESRLPFTKEYRLRRADGAYRTVLVSGVPRLGDDGFFEGYVGSCIDITEIRQANETVRRAEEFTRGTINALAANICVLDERGTILAVNQGWREFAADNPPVPADFAIGCNYLDVCDAATGRDRGDAKKMAAGIRRVLLREVDSYSQEYACHSATEL